MVKQIRSGETLTELIDNGGSYFLWLEEKSGLSGPLSSLLAGCDFVSVDGLDDVLMKSAKEDLRQLYAEEKGINEEGEQDAKKIETIRKSVRGDCCLFEVILHLAMAVNESVNMTDEDATSKYFAMMMDNAGFSLYDEEDWDMHTDIVTKHWTKCMKRILDRTYDERGKGGLFPCRDDEDRLDDRRKTSLWAQMNDWMDQHTNEDGEWVD